MEKAIRNQFNEQVLINGLKKFGVELEDSELIGGFENMVYSFIKDDQKYVLRISHSLHNSFNNVEAELEFIDHLNKNGANVAKPILSDAGHLVEKLSQEEPCFMVTAFEFADGQPPKKENYFDPEFLREYGKSVALMHKLTKNYHPQKRRYQFRDEDFIMRAGEFLTDEDQVIKVKLDELLNEIDNIEKNEDNFGLIHTDVHGGNFFVDQSGKITIFDFDDCCYKHFVSDIAIVLFYTFFLNPDQVEGVTFTFKHFMEGYNQVNKLSVDDIKTLNQFIKLREIVIYIVINRSFPKDNMPEWAQKYLETFRPRILNDVPYVDLDFTKII